MPRQEKRKEPRFRPAQEMFATEHTSGAVVRIRNFSLRAISFESPTRVRVGTPIALEFAHGATTVLVNGVPNRSELIAGAGGRRYLTVLDLRWKTLQERTEVESFLRSIPRSARPA